MPNDPYRYSCTADSVVRSESLHWSDILYTGALLLASLVNGCSSNTGIELPPCAFGVAHAHRPTLRSSASSAMSTSLSRRAIVSTTAIGTQPTSTSPRFRRALHCLAPRCAVHGLRHAVT